MKRRQFTQLCASSVLLPIAASLVACGGGGADGSSQGAEAAAAGGHASAVPALPNERVVVSSKGMAYTLNNDDKSLSQASGIAISGFASGGWQLASQADAYPVDVSFDEAGTAYVLDKTLCEIRVYSPTGQLQTTLAGYGSGPGQLNNPAAVTVVGGRIYVADSANHRVQVFALDGAPLLRFGALETTGEGFNYPRDVEVGADGTIYVLQSVKSVVTVHDSQGNHLRSLDLSRNPQGKRQRVNAIALGPVSELVYTEISTGTVCTLGSQGQITTQRSAQTHYGKPVAARYIAQGRNAQPLLSGFVNLA